MNLDRNSMVSAVIVLFALLIGGYLLFFKDDSPFFKQKAIQLPLDTVQLKFGEKSYKLNYSSYPASELFNIASFETASCSASKAVR